MDATPERLHQDALLASAHGDMEGASLADHSSQQQICFLCRRTLTPDTQAADDLEIGSLCGDCKFLLLEDLSTPVHDSHRRRHSSRSRRNNRAGSSESIENHFTQQVSHMINMMRQSQSPSSGFGDRTPEADFASRRLQRTNSRTPTSGSRRWRRVLSDSDSDGFDNLESLYGDSESNFSFSRYRLFHGDSDAVSLSAYEGDSDDGHSFMNADILVIPDNGSNFDSDTDIDPMHAGLDQWNWDYPEDGEDGEWVEADVEEETVGFTISRAGLNNMFNSSPIDRNLRANNIPISFRHGRGFEQLLDHLAEADSSRRGAPPASAPFVKNLPRIIIGEEHETCDGLSCAICKDVLTVGTEVSSLPCQHLYHPYCILPWLSARNSCPLCRFELPTDDKDYEEGKQRVNSRIEMHEIQEQDASEDGYSDSSSEAEEARELGPSVSGRRDAQNANASANSNSSIREGRNDWLFRAAAPIAGILGIVLVLWLGKPVQASSPPPPNYRGNTSRKRWFFF